MASRRDIRDPLVFVAVAIVRARKRRGWSQADLAHVLDVSQSTACRWEAGTADVPIMTLVRIARALKCSPRDLVPR